MNESYQELQELQERGQAYYACLIDQEHVSETYSQVKSVLDLKTRLLSIPLFGCSLRDELDLHKAVMNFANACISHISTLQNQADLPRLDFPICHDLLRMFRDFNHHEHYLSFRPIRVHVAGKDLGLGFYTHHVLTKIPSIENTHADWCRVARKLTLEKLLDLNYSYVLTTSENQLTSKFKGISFKVSDHQHYGESFIQGSTALEDWENELGT